MQIFNTLTRTKEEFVPLEPGKVKMYSCGPTVYNYFHLGNARPFVMFDLVRRYLEYSGYEVTFVQNFTDVDDKMIRKAQEEGKTLKQLADEYINEYFTDADGLGIHRATFQPRATETMDAILEQIGALIERGHAYVSTDGVYFSTRSFPEYGKLSHFHLDELEEGASDRVADTGENKRDPADFAVWKFKKEGEPSWPAPWGEGRPGWHIECSSMIHQYLGESIDIHSGGQDLIFPHHENEIAQSECATGKPFARYWMHNGFITIQGEKMAKSLGNFRTVREMSEHFPYEVIRFFLLTGHYRSPINFDSELLTAAMHGLERIQNCYEGAKFRLEAMSKADSPAAVDEAAEARLSEAVAAFRESFKKEMDDDMNTPGALAAIFTFVKELNSALAVSPASLEAALKQLTEICDVMGIVYEAKKEGVPAEVMAWVEERTAAKKARDFALADALRAKIQEAGYTVMDTPEGPRVEKA